MWLKLAKLSLRTMSHTTCCTWKALDTVRGTVRGLLKSQIMLFNSIITIILSIKTANLAAWISGKASTSRTTDGGLLPSFSDPVYQWLANCYTHSYLARCMAVKGQWWVWLAQCQYTVAGWDSQLSVAAHATVFVDPSLRYIFCVLGHQTTTKQTQQILCVSRC